MNDPYNQLLDSAIQHLQELKDRGVKFVSVSPEAIRGLSAPGPLRTSRSSSPGASIQPAAQSKTSAEVPRAAAAVPEKIEASHFSVSRAFLKNPSSSLTPEAKLAAFADLHRRASACVKCAHLASSRKNVVFGVGDINARLMFIGEAPGADEDIQGEPFVGKAGQLLTKMIAAMGLSRETVYIANILKCRPDTPGQRYGNRKPTPEEMQTCIPFLHEQIDLIQPGVIVALGGTAVEGLLGKAIPVTRLRGNWHSYRNIPMMPTFHPSYLLRSPWEKRKAWEDMLQVMDKLQIPISEKQRGFFLKAQAG